MQERRTCDSAPTFMPLRAGLAGRRLTGSEAASSRPDWLGAVAGVSDNGILHDNNTRVIVLSLC